MCEWKYMFGIDNLAFSTCSIKLTAWDLGFSLVLFVPRMTTIYLVLSESEG